MPPIFYVELTEYRRTSVQGSPAKKLVKVMTRHYTELYPADPESVVDKLLTGQANESVPSAFYDILTEKLPAYENGAYIKPLSINIQPGNWGHRVDWTIAWEEQLDEEWQDPLEILGIEVYNWSKVSSVNSRTVDYSLGHKILYPDAVDTTVTDTGGTTRVLRTEKPRYTITGKVIGELDYTALRQAIAQNTSVVQFSYTYHIVSGLTDVNIIMEESETEDFSND